MGAYRSSRAEADLIEIWTSIAADDAQAADRQLDRIAEACELLAAHPFAGKIRSDLAAGLRFYPVGNYLIFYLPREDRRCARPARCARLPAGLLG